MNTERLPALPGFRELAERNGQLRRELAERNNQVLREHAERRRELLGELAERRRAAGLSQVEVAARMGTSQPAVARLETGDVDVRMSTVERYAAAVGCRLELRLGPATGSADRRREQDA